MTFTRTRKSKNIGAYINDFIFQLTDYPCNNTYDKFFLINHGYFYDKKMLHHGYFYNTNAFSADKRHAL